MRRGLACAALAAVLLLNGCATLFPHGTPTSSTAMTATAPPLPAAPTGAPVNALHQLPWQTVAAINPYTETACVNLDALSLVYQGLFALQPNFEPQPVLCSALQATADDTRFTITLRTAAFHNGRTVTVDDVLHSLKLAQQAGSRMSQQLAIIETALAIDADTLEITTGRPCPRLAALLDFPITAREDLLQGTGDYRLLAADGGWALQAVTGDTPVSYFELCPVEDRAALAAAFEQSRVQLVRLTAQQLRLQPIGGQFTTLPVDTTRLLYVGFNAKRRALAQGELRRLLAALPDRLAIAGQLLDEVSLTVLPVPPASPLYDQTAARVAAATPEQLRQWRATAPKASLTLLVNGDDADRVQVGERLCAAWQEGGLAVTLKAIPRQQMSDELVAGDFDLYLGMTRLAADFSLAPFVLKDGSLNVGGYAGGAAFEGNLTPSPGSLLQFALQCPIMPLWFERDWLLIRQLTVPAAQPCDSQLLQSFTEWS